MFTDTDLRDPAPPTPGAAERAAVATRAKQIKRNRRAAVAGSALGLVAVLSIGAVALSGGSSDPSSTRVETAATPSTDVAPTTVAPAPTTVAPAPEPTPTTAPAQTPVVQAPTAQETPAPATYTLSGTISNIPEGVTVHLTLVGDGGTFSTSTSTGPYSLSGVPAGTYDARYTWESGGAAQAGRSSVTITGDLVTNFSL